MNATAKILDRLQGVRQTAADRWLARCPTHEDRRPSLSIRDNDGKVLLHCFAGCEVGDILESIGLTLGDLFDAPLKHCGPPSRSRIPAADILQVLSFEVFVAATIGYEMHAAGSIGEVGSDRLAQACARINSARTYCGGR